MCVLASTKHPPPSLHPSLSEAVWASDWGPWAQSPRKLHQSKQRGGTEPREYSDTKGLRRAAEDFRGDSHKAQPLRDSELGSCLSCFPREQSCCFLNKDCQKICRFAACAQSLRFPMNSPVFLSSSVFSEFISICKTATSETRFSKLHWDFARGV